jgi:hypothetical protein
MMTDVTPARFFGFLFGTFESGWLTLFSIDHATTDRRVDWFTVDQLDDMADTAVALSETRDVWFGLATRKRKLDMGQRGGRSECDAIGALWVDIDIAGPNHANASGMLPDADMARHLIRSFPIRPALVVKSGGGYHAYWPLDEPLPADEADLLLKRWAATWAAHSAENGCAVDNVFDIPRVLRVPGTVNHKHGAKQPVEVVLWDDVSYGPSEIIDATIEPPTEQPHTDRRVPYTGLERPGDDFNARHRGGDVLQMAGWTQEPGKGTKRNGDERWLHPWSPTSDESATVFADDGHTTIWSDTVVRMCPTLRKERPYDPFGLYTHLKHGGDWREATIELAKKGYGATTMRSMLGLSDIVSASDTPMSDDEIAAAKEERNGKRTVIVSQRHLDDITNELVDVLLEGNDPPHIFRHGDAVSQFSRGELEAVDRVRMVNVVEMAVRPVALRKDSAQPARVEVAALDLALLRLLDRLPVVQGVVRTPFLRSDGTVCADVGYDFRSGNYLAATSHVVVPDNPTLADVAAAIALIDDMIHDFPLKSRADRAHVFALLLTPMIRHLVPLTPLFIMDGNGPGVGKNLLAESCMYMATGEWVQTDPLPTDSEEQRKQITALLSTGRPVALFDEAHIITGTSLARMITSTTWGDRLLGYSKQVSYPNRVTVVALGNNVEVQGDMPRRSILIRLESNLARPYDRQDFRHDNLRQWVEEHRPEVVGALLTILVAWHQAGRPKGAARLGSFDAWAEIVGGALALAGVDGFMSNIGEMRERGATDEVDMAAHLWELSRHFMGAGFTVKQVARLIEDDRLDVMPPRMGRDRNYVQALGYVYRHYSDRWLGGLRLVNNGTTHGARRYVIEAMPVDNYVKRGGDGGLGGLGPATYKTSEGVEGAGQAIAETPDEVPQVPHRPPADVIASLSQHDPNDAQLNQEDW